MRLGIVTVDDSRETVKKAILKYETRGWSMVRLKYVDAKGLLTGVERRVRDEKSYNVFFPLKSDEDSMVKRRTTWRIELVKKEAQVVCREYA